MISQLIREREAAELIGVAPATLNRWRCERIGPPWLRLNGRTVRYDRKEVVRWLEESRVTPAEAKA